MVSLGFVVVSEGLLWSFKSRVGQHIICWVNPPDYFVDIGLKLVGPKLGPFGLKRWDSHG